MVQIDYDQVLLVMLFVAYADTSMHYVSWKLYVMLVALHEIGLDGYLGLHERKDRRCYKEF